jgi:hypothetical protein
MNLEETAEVAKIQKSNSQIQGNIKIQPSTPRLAVAATCMVGMRDFHA